MERYTNEETFEKLRGGLIVSCQALEEEPLHSSYIMSRMAYAAYLGGAVGIRANTVEDIAAIKTTVNLPVIGIIKRVYESCDVYITPTIEEVNKLVASGVEIIAVDATKRPRPRGVSLSGFFADVKKKHPGQLFMADCATIDEGLHAADLGFDIIATTMAGYTPQTSGVCPPAYAMMEALVQRSGKPVIAEGGIWSPEQLARAMDTGIFAAVVGSAITRPLEITRRFVAAIRG